MNQKLLNCAIIVLALIIGFSINNIANSKTETNYKIAVIDMQKIYENSNNLKNLKSEQDKKIQNLEFEINNARNEILNEKNPEKASLMEEKYRNEINNKKIAIDTEYNQNMIKINNDIKNTIIQKAKNMDYEIVLPKNTIILGGNDITEKILPDIK